MTSRPDNAEGTAELRAKIESLRHTERDPFVDSVGTKALFRGVSCHSGIIHKLYVRPPDGTPDIAVYISELPVVASEPIDILAPSKWLVAGSLISDNDHVMAIGFLELT